MMIGICDDERLILDQLKKMIEECICNNGWDAKIITFQTGRKLLERVSELDACFLDISMPDLNGIETGKYIQIRNKNCKIIMATSKVECFKETFKIHAFRFITKPFDMDEIKEALQAVMNLQMGKETIDLYKDRILYPIYQREINYIISYDSDVEFVVANKVFRKDTSLKELEKIMNKDLFFRVNKQYIVNMLCIENYTNGIITINGIKIPVSRRKKKTFELTYIEFDLKFR